MSRVEFRNLTRLSNLTFMEMMMLDFESVHEPAAAQSALQQLQRNAEDRFGIATKELKEKIEATFDIEVSSSFLNVLRRKGNGLDLFEIQGDVNEHAAVLPKFVRKNRVKKTLEEWEDSLRRR